MGSFADMDLLLSGYVVTAAALRAGVGDVLARLRDHPLRVKTKQRRWLANRLQFGLFFFALYA